MWQIIRGGLLQIIHQFLLHVDVDIAVADKGAGVVGVAGEGGNQVLVLDLFVDVADKSAAGHVAAGDFIEGAVLRAGPCTFPGWPWP